MIRDVDFEDIRIYLILCISNNRNKYIKTFLEMENFSKHFQEFESQYTKIKEIEVSNNIVK